MSHRIAAVLSLALWLPIVAPCEGLGQSASPDASAGVVVMVDAIHPWVDTGVAVQKGDRVLFAAVGTIQWGPQPDQVTGPQGRDAKSGKIGKGGLIGRVGTTGKPFAIGDTHTPIVMSKSGELFLGINDFVFADNSGAFTVRISRHGVP